MTQEELNQILTRLELRHTDLALLAKVTTRCVNNWTSGRWPVPRPVAILLRAIDNGFITEAWLSDQIYLERHLVERQSRVGNPV
jgi:hypothetical protein